MTKISLKKASLLGLVLIGASAVTAAIIPSAKEEDKFFEDNGTLTASDSQNPNGSQGQSCTDNTNEAEPNCVLTAGSATTGTGINSGVTNTAGGGNTSA